MMEPVELSGYHPPEVTFSKMEPSKQSAEGDERAGLEAIEDGDIDRASRSAPPLLQTPRRRTWRRSRVLPCLLGPFNHAEHIWKVGALFNAPIF